MADLVTMLVTKVIGERDIEIVKKALNEGCTVEFISRITGLDESAIIEIKDEQEKNG